MTTAFPARLLADIGATNARYAWQDTDGEAPKDVRIYPCKDHPTLQASMEAYLRDTGRPAPRWCAVGIANPVTGDQVKMTNHDWSFSISQLRAALGMERLVVINDFTALALALPALKPDELVQVGGGAPVADAAIGLIGPGTGLGVSGLIPSGTPGRYVPLQGEGGHVSLSPATAREAEVVLALYRRYGHASVERAVSGSGLVWLYEALLDLEGAPAGTTVPEAAEISRRALAQEDPRSIETLSLFFAFLGSAAGNLALTLGAVGGIYVGGGIVPRMLDTFRASSFRERFEAKGRFRPLLAGIPVYVITAATSPALLGASRAL